MTRFPTLLALAGLVACQQTPPPKPAEQAGPAPGTPEWKIQNAMSAAPAAIGQNATILDWPANPQAQAAQLRAGSNGWTCFPDMPHTPGNDPMCLDRTFAAWAAAWTAHTKPVIKGVGLAYMLQGGSDASNTDPFKTTPDSGEEWVNSGPHVMMIVPEVARLAGMPTDYRSGAPWIMFQNTPYAHVMLPVK